LQLKFGARVRGPRDIQQALDMPSDLALQAGLNVRLGQQIAGLLRDLFELADHRRLLRDFFRQRPAGEMLLR